jgi:tetratricopeptide (TPR) repeat protein
VISLEASPTKAVFISVGKYHDARIYINGVLAVPTADWSDTELILRCSPQAQATLRPGRNSVAVHCEDADRSAPIEVRLLEGGELSPDPVEFEFERLLNEEPERADLYAARGGYFASRAEWQPAINSFIRASELEAMNWQFRASLAFLRLVANERPAYELGRSTLLADFAKIERSEAAQEIAFVALLVPAESAAREAADKLAATAADQEYADAGLPARQLTKGLRDYRCGRFVEAIAACEKAKANAALKILPGWTHERERNFFVAADAIKAMAYQAVGQKTQAGETIRAAVEFADAEFPAMDGGNIGGDWKDMLAARTLLKEAQTMVGISASPR